jgi:hypothetical protein
VGRKLLGGAPDHIMLAQEGIGKALAGLADVQGRGDGQLHDRRQIPQGVALGLDKLHRNGTTGKAKHQLPQTVDVIIPAGADVMQFGDVDLGKLRGDELASKL